jgi:hypothetical protein
VSTPSASSRASEPSARFARAVLADARTRTLRRVIVDAGIADDGTDRGVSLSLVMADARAATRHTLVFEPDAAGRLDEPRHRYHRASVPVPSGARVYPYEAELLRMLRIAPPDRATEECGIYYFESERAGLSIDDQDYYVVDRSIAGPRAQRALRDALLAAIDRDMDLQIVDAPVVDGARQVRFTFEGADGSAVIAARLARDGVVAAVEVRRSAGTRAWQVYTRRSDLGQYLRGRHRIGRIEIGEQSPSGDEATVVLDGRVTIDLGDFEPGDFECPC